MTREKLRDRRRDATSARRLDLVSVVLLGAVALLQVIAAVGIPPGSATASGRPVSAGLGGLLDAFVLIVLAIQRAERVAWARPAAVACLLILIAATFLGAMGQPQIAAVMIPLACVTVVVIVLQRRGHTAAAALGPRLPPAVLAVAIFIAGAMLQLIPVL